jgi:hypothetical protein
MLIVITDEMRSHWVIRTKKGYNPTYILKEFS